MIVEKMLEYLVLESVLKKASFCENDIVVCGESIPVDVYAMHDRKDDLIREFIEPYVLSTNSKE